MPDIEGAAQLGFAVGIDGDVLVASAPRFFLDFPYESGPGAIYVFRRDDHGTPGNPWDDSWPLEAKLTAPNSEQGDVLGFSLAISGDVIVVGKPAVNPTAEVYRRDGINWNHETSLIGEFNDQFGFSVAAHGDRIIVGAPSRATFRGSAFVFKFEGSNWAQEDELKPTNPINVGYFGEAVAIYSGLAVAGAPNTKLLTSVDGAAYPFAFDNTVGSWREESTITVTNPALYQELGSGVAIERDLLLVGRYGHPSAFLFQREGGAWVQRDRLFGDATHYAYVMALEGNHALIYSQVFAVRERHNLKDYALFQGCFSAEATAEVCPECQPFDLAGDGRVDLGDFEQFMGTFAGP